MNRGLGRRGLWLVVVAAAIVALGAGVAYATGAIASGSGEVIVGCAKNANGQLRVVNDVSQCLPSEHAVTFAAPQPPPGPQAVLVDCAAGQTVGEALAQTANATSVWARSVVQRE